MLRSLETSPLQRSERRALRAGRAQLHAFHFAHPPLSGPDRAPHAGRASRRQALRGGHAQASPIQSSDTERRAAEAERELVEWKKVKFMIDHVGDEFAALIISTTRFGFFVELEDLFIEGLVPIDYAAGRPFQVSRKHPQDHRRAQPAYLFDRRPRAGASGPRRCRGKEAAVRPSIQIDGSGQEPEKTLMR